MRKMIVGIVNKYSNTLATKIGLSTNMKTSIRSTVRVRKLVKYKVLKTSKTGVCGGI